jgi:hypothetical protein
MHFFELAVLSSISPQTLAVTLFLLGGQKGLKHAWLFVSGTLITSVVAGLVVAAGLGDLGIHLNGVGGGTNFPGIYITLGVLVLLFAAYVWWRHVRARLNPHKKDRTRETRRLNHMVESSWVALGVGLVFGMPGVGYALALAEVSGRSWGFILAAVIVFSLISYSWGWIPNVWYMLDRDRAVRVLTRFRAAIAKHDIAIITVVLIIVGLYLVIFGLVTE